MDDDSSPCRLYDVDQDVRFHNSLKRRPWTKGAATMVPTVRPAQPEPDEPTPVPDAHQLAARMRTMVGGLLDELTAAVVGAYGPTEDALCRAGDMIDLLLRNGGLTGDDLDRLRDITEPYGLLIHADGGVSELAPITATWRRLRRAAAEADAADRELAVRPDWSPEFYFVELEARDRAVRALRSVVATFNTVQEKLGSPIRAENIPIYRIR